MDNRSNHNQLLDVAALHAGDTIVSRNDMVQMLFPKAITPPSENMLSNIRTKLLQLVAEMENILCDRHKDDAPALPLTWSLMTQSGFVTDTTLLDFLLARFAEERLVQVLERQDRNAALVQLPARLLSDANPHIVGAAQSLLAADSLNHQSSISVHHQMGAEMLHQLCWQTVAALEIVHGEKSPVIVDAARELLAFHDESNTARLAARKLIHFLGGSHKEDLRNPQLAGLHLFVASMAGDLNIDHDYILRLMDSPSSAPIAILLKAWNITKIDAMDIVFTIRQFELRPQEINLFDNAYDEIDGETALREVHKWNISRLGTQTDQGDN